MYLRENISSTILEPKNGSKIDVISVDLNLRKEKMGLKLFIQST